MSILEALLQGIIQGLGEFLPISSSGHLSIFQYFTSQGGEEGALFSVLLHMGTLAAVLIAFWDTIWDLICAFFRMIQDIFQRRFSVWSPPYHQRMILLLIVSLLPLFLTLFFKEPLRKVATDNDIVVEGVCFLVTGALLYLADCCLPGRGKAGEMSYRAALCIGLVQAISTLPGISRSGSTLAIGMLLGLDRKFAVTFSFIMGIPAVCAAILLYAKDILGGELSIELAPMLIGLAASTIFGLLAIWMVRWLVNSQKLRFFAYYTLGLGAVVSILGGYEMMMGHPIQKAITTLFAG